jgi:TonB-linked SusC/RagA family outer membrane protein
MRQLRLFMLCLLGLVILPVRADAQGSGSITGQVLDRTTRAPLTNVLVTVNGTTLSSVTNQQGRYVIQNVPSGTHELRVSMLGYGRASQSVNVNAGGSATADFQLDVSALELEGIVVTATGQEQRKREIGNTVTNINAADMDLAPVQSLTNLLQGRAPGVVIQPTSGSLGTGARVRIRGNSSVSLSGTPLVLIDGIRVSNEVEATGMFTGGTSSSRWEDINPDDIETVEILKGPAASALYGTAAANGVIQITTKRGIGGRTELRTYAERSAFVIPEDQVPDNVRARGFRTDLNARGDCSIVEIARAVCTAPDSVYRWNPLLDSNNSPHRDGAQDRLGFSVSGGSADSRMTFFLGAERTKGHGTLRANELERDNLRANFTGAARENLRLTASTNFITSFLELPQEGNTGSGPYLNAFFGADPSPANVTRGGGFRFPFTADNVGWWMNEENLRRFVGSLAADWTPTHWIRFNAVAGIDQINRFELSTIPVPGLADGFFAEGLREQYRTQDREFTTSLNANVNRALTSTINSTTALGVQYNETTADWTYAAGSGLAPGTLTSSEALSVQEFFGETKLFGVYASQQFALWDRLFLSAAVRGDQNSAFGDNIGFVVYPAFSASWVVREEPWFPQFEPLSMLRLRAAYGASGQRPGRLSAVRTYDTQAVTLDESITSGFVVSNAGNPDLTAEISKELELGFDAGILNDRISLELTHYNKTTTDALVARPLPPSIGGPVSQFFNLGEVNNRGWEATLNIDALRRTNFDLHFAVNFAANKNKLVALGDTTIPPITIGTQRHIEGYPLGGYWSQRFHYADDNNDGIIQPAEVALDSIQDDTIADLSYMGQPFPTRELSFNADVTLFGMFRLSGQLDHKGGHKLFNWAGRLRCAEASGSYCEARMQPGAANIDEQARIIARRTVGVGSQAGFIEDASFWKLREVALTFTVPERWVERVRFANTLQISLAGRNLHTWTDYTGLDPESNIPTSVDNATDPGRFYTVDLFTVPLPRVFTLRFDVGM